MGTLTKAQKREPCRFDDTDEYSCSNYPCILCHGPRGEIERAALAAAKAAQLPDDSKSGGPRS